VSLLDGLHPVTTEGQILLHIANQLDVLVDKLAPVQQDEAPVEPAEPEPESAPDDKPQPKKAPAKKATRRKVTGQ
jgi:hypothetical protein